MADLVGLGARIMRGDGPELQGVLEAVGEAIIVRDREDRFVYANRAALTSLGFATLEELAGRSLADVMARFIVHDEHGRAVPRDALPSARLMSSGLPAAPLLLHCVDRVSGVGSWLVLTASPLHDTSGAVVAAVTVIENVTALKAAEVHTRVLAQSGRLLSASLDHEQTLRNVAEVALPGLADWCLVELVSGGVREHAVVAHIDPAGRALAAQLRALEPAHPTEGSAIGRVLATGESELIFEVSDEYLRRVAVSDEQLRILRELSIRSAAVVPMAVGGRAIGAMSFFTSTSGRRFTEADLALAEQLARRAAVAVENSRLHTTLSEVADTLQRSLLPHELPDVPGWEIGALYQPARDEPRIEVGGDFYEVFDTDGSAFAMIGDVTGHGIAAATLTSLMRHGARFASHLEPDPVAIVRRLDEELRRRGDLTLCTALVAALHDRSVMLCSAGHPPALIADAAGAVREVPESGPLLGAFPDSIWQQERVIVADGDLLLLYTDGVTERPGPEGRYGSDRLAAFLSHCAGSAPQALLDALAAELEAFGAGQPGDDIAALALRARPR
jgi:serine phosphatase RsbU (regulator of sigma subunit)